MKLTDLLKEDLNEGTCGFTPDGKPRNKPAGPDLIRKAIRKEIKTLHEDKGNDLARNMIAKLREKTYRKMSDLELDSFSIDMIAHFLDNYEARAYAKRKLDSKTSRLDTLEENINPEVTKAVNRFIKGMANKYDYSEQDAVFAIMRVLRQGNFEL